MDPLTAIGLVSNIISFIDFSARLVKGAKEIHDSQHGVLEENRSRETIVQEVQRMSARLLTSESPEKEDEISTLRILAAECREVSTQLMSLLEKIKPSDPGSKTQSLLSAMRNKVHDSERAGLEERISDCRAQLHLELSYLTRNETLKKLESLVQASKMDESKLDKIERNVVQLREFISTAPSTSEAKPMLMTLLSEEEKVFTTIAQDRILNSLSYEDMNRRSNMVVETHSNTYEWILEEDDVPEQPSPDDAQNSEVENDAKQPRRIEDIEKVRARDKLRTWLESGSSRDVFHLSGKLGSGKSTLMKHIRASPRTEEKLQKWADGRKLTIANFYFWNIGSDYEKSLRGLYTSLLYQIFRQCPELIPKVWPAHWAQAHSAPWIISRTIDITNKDINEAFISVINSHEVLERHCFAFFIDGLDEFQSTVQHDQRDLVKLLCHWAASESGNIKICVSSREYPVFMDGFTSTLRIRFHDLTRRDMDIYIRDKLRHASSEDSFETLVSLIMNKANGVFLWVALVVKSLREGLEDGLSCLDLMQEVDILPEQLESLYKHILTSMGKSKRKKAYQTFSMVSELKKQNNYRMSLLAYSFLEDYEAGESFFMNGNNLFPMNRLTGDHGKKRAESSSRRLAGWCKGLVEPYERQVFAPALEDQSPCVTAWEDWEMELDFAHRSVSDFLSSEEVQRDMELNLKGFNHVDAVLNLIVSDILYENGTSIYNTSRSGITSTVLLDIMDSYGLIQEPYTFLQRFRELLAVGKTKERMSANTLFYLPVSQLAGRFGYYAVVNWAGYISETPETVAKTVDMSSDGRQRVDKKRHFISDPLQVLMVLGRCHYPLWHIARKSELLEQVEVVTMLACFCLSDYAPRRQGEAHESLKFLEALLEEGWLSPNTITPWRPVLDGPFWSTKGPGKSSGLTLWHYFLILLLTRRYQPQRATMALAAKKGCGPLSKYHQDVFRLFLKSKPETEFSFEICMNEDISGVKRDFSLNLGKQGMVFQFTAQPPPPLPEHGWRLPWQESEIGLPSGNGTGTRRHFSLREFIEISLFENEDEILEMLDEQTKPTDNGQPNDTTTTASVVGKADRIDDQRQGEDDENQRNTTWASNSGVKNNLDFQHHFDIYSQWARILLRNEYVRYTAAVLTGVILTTLFTYIREKTGKPGPV